MTFIQDREIRLCTPKAGVLSAELLSITAFCVLTADLFPLRVIPGDYPSNEPETFTAATPIRCYKSPNPDPTNRAGLTWVKDLSDSDFQTFFDFDDTPGL